MFFKKLKLAGLATAVVLSHTAQAQVTSTFKSNATLSTSCLLSVTDINFGAIAPSTTGSTSTNATGTVSAQCTSGTAYTIAISMGNGVSTRLMTGKNGGQQISYSICQQPGWTNAGGQFGSTCTVKPWYSTSGGGGYTLSSTGTGSTQNFTMYGYVPNGYYTPDTYTDTNIVTVSY